MRPGSLELKVPPPAVAFALASAMWYASELLPAAAFTLVWRVPIAALAAGAGAVFALSGLAAFRKARTTFNPTRPYAATSIVRAGPYRISRNPMYVGLLFVLTAWATCLSNPAAFLMLPGFVAYMNRFQIKPEERILTEKFGAEFTTYMGSVRRWL